MTPHSFPTESSAPTTDYIRPSVRLDPGGLGRVFIAVLVCIVLTGVQIALGGTGVASILFGAATFFGFLAVLEAGPLTALGVLNLVLVARFLLGAYLIKNGIQGLPITLGLLEPEDTGSVMALGFLGVWLATICVCRYVPRLPIFNIANTDEGLRIMTIVMLVGGTISIVAIRVVSGEDGETSGGAWGLAKEFLAFRTACLPTLMLYLWRTGSRRWLTHPAVLFVTILFFLQGVLGSSKQGMAEPFALYTMMAIARYGWRHPIFWLGIPAAILLFQFFISPIGQYARNQGGRDKSPKQAAIATADIIAGYLTDSQFRDLVYHFNDDVVDVNKKQSTYLPGALNTYNRFAMIGESDRLVSATDRFGYTGFETVEVAVLYLVPHFIYPNKPQSNSSNNLGRFTGDISDEDLGTQVSYGFIANGYNAFGMIWVLPLSFLCACALLGCTRLSTAGVFYTDPWSIIAVATLHQAYVEAPFTGQFGAFHQPIDALILFLMTGAVGWALRLQGRFGASGERSRAAPQ